jgi:signal transduction histidine kinase
VLTNLLSNAIRYAPEESCVRVATRPLGQGDGRFVELSVTDEGPGVPPAERERIFRPYVRGSDRGQGGGLGLGLAICKRLVEAHGGAIVVRDAPGGGSCFAFTLPAAPPVAEDG